jgi:hypothetical protein
MNETLELDVAQYAQLLADQQRLTELQAFDLQQRYFAQPVLDRLTFGTGNPADQTLRGDQRDRFKGVTILNPSAKVIFIGFGAGSAAGSPLHCPANSGIVWPAVFSELSLSVSNADSQAAASDVAVLRLWVPPQQPSVFPYAT